MNRAAFSVLLCLALLPSRLVAAEPVARERLLDRDVDIVYAAIDDAAARKDPGSAMPLLEGALATPYPHVAVLCGDAARALPPAGLADAKIDALVKKTTRAADVPRTQNLVRFLAATRDPRFDATLAWGCAATRPVEVQIEAVASCGGMGRVDAKQYPKTAEAIGDALGNPRPEVRAAACASVGRMRLSAYADAVLRIAFGGGEEIEGAFAAVAARRLGLTGRLAAAKRALGAATNSVRRTIVLRTISLLGESQDGGSQDIAALVEMLHSPKPDEREAAARSVALARAREPDVPLGAAGPEWAPVGRALVVLTFDDPMWNVREAARVAALRIAGPAREAFAPRVVTAFENKDDDVALAALECAGEMGVTEAASALVALVTGRADERRRDFAARALGRLGEHNAVERLRPALSGPGTSETSRRGAARALGFVPSKEAVDALVARLADADLATVEREEVERSLERLTGRRIGAAAAWSAWLAATPSPLVAELRRFDRASLRRERADGARPTAHADAERAVESALRWLERQQHPLGEWAGAENGYGGLPSAGTVYTGLSALAFLGAGYSATAGRFREVVRRATDFLAAVQQHDGSYTSDTSEWIAWLSPVCDVAMVEAGTLGGDRDAWRFAQRAVDALLRRQLPGWGLSLDMQPTKNASLAPTVWAALGFAVARADGLDVPRRAFDGIDAWMEAVASDASGLAEDPADATRAPDLDVGGSQGPLAYAWWNVMPLRDRRDRGPRPDVTLTEAGLVIRLLEGWPRGHPYAVGAARVLAGQPPTWEGGAVFGDGRKLGHRSFYWQFSLLGMHAAGGGRWRAFAETARRMLVEHQRIDPPELVGSWDPDLRYAHSEGRVEATAAGVLALEAPYRYPLPIAR